jgi:hypothetical protein
MTHAKILMEIAKYLDARYITHYEIEGYFGFAYLTIPCRDGEIKLKFDLVQDEVEIEELPSETIS